MLALLLIIFPVFAAEAASPGTMTSDPGFAIGSTSLSGALCFGVWHLRGMLDTVIKFLSETGIRIQVHHHIAQPEKHEPD